MGAWFMLTTTKSREQCFSYVAKDEARSCTGYKDKE
jgi:hypothetical protein